MQHHPAHGKKIVNWMNSLEWTGGVQSARRDDDESTRAADKRAACLDERFDVGREREGEGLRVQHHAAHARHLGSPLGVTALLFRAT